MGHIIGLHGLPGSGKDTLAEFYVNRLGYTRLAFADVVYREVAEAFGVSEADLRSREWKTSPQEALQVRKCADAGFVDMVASGFPRFLSGLRSSREILQLWGTEYRRAQCPDYCIRKLEEEMQAHLAAGFGHFVVTDIRLYPAPGRLGEFSCNEATYIRAKPHSVVIEVVRPGEARSTGHGSDTRLPQALIDFTVTNSGTPEELYQNTVKLEY